MSTTANKPCKKCGLVAPEKVMVYCASCVHRRGQPENMRCAAPPIPTKTTFYAEVKQYPACWQKNSGNNCLEYEPTGYQKQKLEQKLKSVIVDPPEVQGEPGVHWTAWLFLCLVHFTLGAWVGTLV